MRTMNCLKLHQLTNQHHRRMTHPLYKNPLIFNKKLILRFEHLARRIQQTRARMFACGSGFHFGHHLLVASFVVLVAESLLSIANAL